MKKCLFTLFLIIATSCDLEPQSGQWYEHRGTRERVQLKHVGSGEQCFRVARTVAEGQNEVFRKTRGYEPFHVSYDTNKAKSRCVFFSEEGDVTRKFFMTYYRIIPIQDLKRDYTLVE